MKTYFLNNGLSLIKKYYPDCDELKIEEIRYGLEGIYLTLTKLIIIFLTSAILGIFKEMLLLLIFFNILRTTGFGMHAQKSWICLVTSSIMFVGGALLAVNISLNIYLKAILGIASIILIYLYSPADTKKRPLVNKKKREIYKTITTVNSIILVFISMLSNNVTISNLIILGVIFEVVMILPITYKIFKLPYNNYKTYKY